MVAGARLRFSSLACSLALVSACGPFVILADDVASDASTETSDTTATSTSSTTAATSTTTSTVTITSATTPPSMDATTDEPREPSYCAQACESTADCAAGGIDPADYPCIDGFCEFIGEVPACDPATCDDLLIGVCTEVEGISQCATPCTDDSMCLAGFTECTGTDDAGNSICELIPCYGMAEGQPCEFEGFGQLGLCIDGECQCTEDSQCTADGYGCNT
jgi:hypothetical protein